MKALNHFIFMSEVGFRLSLAIEEFGDVPKDQLLEKLPIDIHIYYGFGKKPKKSTFDIPVQIETFEPDTKQITPEVFESLEKWYNYFASFKGQNTKFLLFAKTSNINTNIGSGFISSEIHFGYMLLLGINEFLYVTVNRDVFTRLTQGKLMIPPSLAAVMERSNIGVNTVNNLFENFRHERENHFVEINNSSQNLETLSFDQITPQPEQITNITIWKRYEVLLFSLNNLFFAIDEHFRNLDRTISLDPEVVKEICTSILNRHQTMTEIIANNENDDDEI